MSIEPKTRNTWLDLSLWQERWKHWMALALCLALAGLVGLLIGNGLHRLLYLCGTILLLFVGVLGLGRRVWVLIPLGWYLSAYTGVLPIPLSIRDMTVLLAGFTFVSYQIISGVSRRHGFTVLDGVLWLNLGYIAVTLLVNPVGFYIFGAETVGARIVFDIALASVAYYVIVRLPESRLDVARLPLFLMTGALVLSTLYLSSYLFPSLLERLPYLYAALDIGSFTGVRETLADLPRYKRLGDGGLALVLVLFAYYAPRALFNPLKPRFYFLLLGLAGVLASGFRSVMLWALVGLWLGAWLHGQWREMLVAGFLTALLIGVLAFGQGRVYNLPIPAQRTLSFMPGAWSPAVREDAENSTKFRFEWWREIIDTHVIKNWWLGDGFGTKIEDMIAANLLGGGVAGMTVGGSFHNGPLTTIRYCGIFGLIFFYGLTISCAVTAVRCVRRARGTLLQPVAIYLATQSIWIPFHFTLVFGAYNGDMPQQVMLAGFLRLLVRMLDEQTVKAEDPVRSQPTMRWRRVAAAH